MSTAPDRRRELGSFIREQRTVARLSLRRVAELAGVSNPYLSQIERGLRRPSARILRQIAEALSLSAETLYVQAGLLDDPPVAEVGSDLLAMIEADPWLEPGQKMALAADYLRYREENDGAAPG